MSFVNNYYPVQGTVEHELTIGQTISIVLANEKVPKEAYEVIVYARVLTGHCPGQNTNGELTVSTNIPNGPVERKVFCSFFDQQAWSYNSENISLPVAPDGPRSVTATLKGPSGVENAYGYVQVVAYCK